jgi:hypothetical protein
MPACLRVQQAGEQTGQDDLPLQMKHPIIPTIINYAVVTDQQKFGGNGRPESKAREWADELAGEQQQKHAANGDGQRVQVDGVEAFPDGGQTLSVWRKGGNFDFGEMLYSSTHFKIAYTVAHGFCWVRLGQVVSVDGAAIGQDGEGKVLQALGLGNSDAAAAPLLAV